jgi:hypothetical protein
MTTFSFLKTPESPEGGKKFEIVPLTPPSPARGEGKQRGQGKIWDFTSLSDVSSSKKGGK